MNWNLRRIYKNRYVAPNHTCHNMLHQYLLYRVPLCTLGRQIEHLVRVHCRQEICSWPVQTCGCKFPVVYQATVQEKGFSHVPVCVVDRTTVSPRGGTQNKTGIEKIDDLHYSSHSSVEIVSFLIRVLTDISKCINLEFF